MAVAPAVGWGAAGPKSGRHAACFMRRATPFAPPRRISERLRRSSFAAASSYRNTGTPNRSATSAAVLVASSTHSSIVAPLSGTNGTTSTAPMRGWTPSCDRRSIASTATLNRRSTASCRGARLADEGVDRAVVRWIGRLIEHVHAGNGDGGAKRGDDVGATSFADVRYALNQRHYALVSQLILPHNLPASMSDPLRTNPTNQSPASIDGDAERDAKIESLLIAGLDHYFASDYAQAIDIWTRALFLDRNHARARAYIDRARSAMAEQQRESEELLHNGVAAFERGEIEAARQMLNAAVQRGGAHDVALAFLTRIDRIHAATPMEPAPMAPPSRLPFRPRTAASDRPGSRWASVAIVMFLLAAGAVVAIASWDGIRESDPGADARCRRRTGAGAGHRGAPRGAAKLRDGARSRSSAVRVRPSVRCASRDRSRAADRSAACRRRQVESGDSARASRIRNLTGGAATKQ